MFLPLQVCNVCMYHGAGLKHNWEYSLLRISNIVRYIHSKKGSYVRRSSIVSPSTLVPYALALFLYRTLDIDEKSAHVLRVLSSYDILHAIHLCVRSIIMLKTLMCIIAYFLIH